MTQTLVQLFLQNQNSENTSQVLMSMGTL